MSCEKLLRDYLRQRGLRLTHQRELVLSVLHELEAPTTAEEIFARVRIRSQNIDISTVYRTLELFQELQLVSGFDAGDGIRRYEHLGVAAPHHHLVCQTCGKSLSVPLAELASLTAYLAETYHFATDPGGLTLSGVCATCQKA